MPALQTAGLIKAIPNSNKYTINYSWAATGTVTGLLGNPPAVPNVAC
jgi:hypothetical protein